MEWVVPFVIVVGSICVTLCCLTAAYRVSKEEAFKKMVRRWIDTGKVVRASHLAQKPAPPLPEFLRDASDEDAISMHGLTPREELVIEEQKKSGGMWLASRARLLMDRKGDIEQRVRLRVERARSVNMETLKARISSPREGDFGASPGLSENSTLDDPSTSPVTDASPLIDSPCNPQAKRMFGSPGSGFRVRPSIATPPNRSRPDSGYRSRVTPPSRPGSGYRSRPTPPSRPGSAAKYIAEHIADDDNEGDVLAIVEDDGGGAIGAAAAAQVDYMAARPGSAKQVTPPSRKAPVLEKRPKSAFAKSAERAAPVLDLETKVSDFDEEELVLSDDEAETRNRAALERARSSRSKPRIRKTAFPWEAPDEKPSPSAWEAEEKPSPVPSWDDQPSADVVMSPGPPVYDDRSLREYYDEADGDDEPLSETSSVDETELAAALNTPAPAVATSPLKNSPSSPKLQKSPSRWDGMRAAPLPRAAPVAPPQRDAPQLPPQRNAPILEI